MKIIILDGATPIYGGLSWDALKDYAEVTYYPTSRNSEIISKISGAQALITNKVKIDRAVMQNSPSLKYIGVSATGYDMVDVACAKEFGIAVTNVAAYSTTAVAQHVFSLILAQYSKVMHYDKLVKNGDWSRSEDFCLLDLPILELANKNIAIFGFGNIGKRVAKIAESFSMNVLIGPTPGSESKDRLQLVELLSDADIVSLHCPLNNFTRHMVDKEFLLKMKKTAILINTSRGGLVNQEDLHQALTKKLIAHACLDVLDCEPPTSGNKLFELNNITITPHVAWGSVEARKRLIQEVALNLKDFLEGGFRNRVEL